MRCDTNFMYMNEARVAGIVAEAPWRETYRNGETFIRFRLQVENKRRRRRDDAIQLFNTIITVDAYGNLAALIEDRAMPGLPMYVSGHIENGSKNHVGFIRIVAEAVDFFSETTNL